MGDRKEGSDTFHADADQIATVRSYAKALGFNIHVLPAELSVSGGKPIEERPSLKAAIEGVESGKYDGIVVAYLSRLTRSRSGLEIWDRVEAAGGHVHSAAENLDTSTPNGRFVRDIHLANAVREREEHVERFKNRREAATAAGIWQRRQMPLGYSKDPVTRRLIPNDDAVAVVQAFKDAAGGRSKSAIARDLNMTPGGARAMLRNRVYLGELKVGEHVNSAAHPPLVDETLFLSAQSKGTRHARKIGEGPALLAGLVRCAGCGHLMPRSINFRQSAYVCSRNHSGQRCPQPASISLNKLDAHVTEIALQELQNIRAVGGAENERVDEARETLEAAKTELATYITSVSAADIGAGLFKQGAAARQSAVEDAQADLQRALEGMTLPMELDGVEAWDKLDIAARNSLLRFALDCVNVRSAGGQRNAPLEDRVRVIRDGSYPMPVKRGSAPLGIVPVPFPDHDSPVVLRVQERKLETQRAA